MNLVPHGTGLPAMVPGQHPTGYGKKMTALHRQGDGLVEKSGTYNQGLGYITQIFQAVPGEGLEYNRTGEVAQVQRCEDPVTLDSGPATLLQATEEG